MGTQNMVEVTLAEILRAINPLREDLESRIQIIDQLRMVVNSIESLKGATVDPFGSFLSQLYSRWGDLDLSIELANGSHILAPAKKHKHMLLEDVLKALKKTGSFRRMQFVSHARVPIVKLESKLRNISCDISINNLSGHMKSKFILWISLIDRRFRDMVLLVKEWAKANGINNPKCGTFNSYSLSLLVIFHFQTCAPAILPPLEEIYPGNMADELIGVRADVERRMEEIAVSNIERFKNKRRYNRCSLSELFTSFFGKFLDLINRTKEQGVCTYSGRWENISTNTRWLPRTYSIFIEDPFEQPQNTARAVDQTRLRKISSAFQTTYYLLISPNITRDSLIPSLLRHEVSGCFPGAAFAIPRADVRTYPRSNQNASFHNQSSSQHHKGQNGKQSILGRPPVQVANQQLSRETRSKGQNGKHLSSEPQVHVANQHSTREKSGSQCQNVNQPETVSKGQTDKIYRRRHQNVERPKMVSKWQNGKQHESQHQNVDGPKTVSKGQNGEQSGSQPQNVDLPETISKEQNGKRSSTGQGQAANQQLPKSGSRSQNVDRTKSDSKRRNAKQLSPGPTKKGFKEAKKGSKGQNGRVQGHIPNQQLPREKHGQNMDQQKTVMEGQNSKGTSAGQVQVQVPPVPVSSPPWPHTLQPKCSNDGPSQMCSKRSSADSAAQAQNVWRPKQNEK